MEDVRVPSVSEIQLAPGDILYREGAPNDHAYVIETGEVVLYRIQDGERIDVEKRRAGAIIGELSILTNQPRAVTVEALTATTVYRISADRIRRRFETIDPILRACIDTSINFVGTFTKQTKPSSTDVHFAASTLRNAEDQIEQFRLETDILRGLEREEFSLVFQPIMRLRDCSLAGFEALMRWRHPQLGDVPPDRFIRVAEETDTIKPLTEFALAEGCFTLRRMLDLEGSPKNLFLSVNVSGRDIARHGFADFVDFVINAAGLVPNHINLEITETALVPDAESTHENFRRFKLLDCGISIDDFGTGHANLAYLKAIPVTTLKIDRIFAGDARNSPISQSIVNLLIRLGKDLGVNVVAEGLESKEDVDMLRALGCEFGQGYYFHKPMREHDLKRLILGRDMGAEIG